MFENRTHRLELKGNGIEGVCAVVFPLSVSRHYACRFMQRHGYEVIDSNPPAQRRDRYEKSYLIKVG